MQLRSELLNQALILLEQGDAVRAMSMYERIVSESPEFAEGWTMLGAICHETGDPVRASSCFEKALLIDSQNADAHFHYGTFFSKSGSLDEAKRHLELAVIADPKHADAWVALAGVQGLIGNAHEAEFSSRRAIALIEDFAEAHVVLGNALVQQSRAEEALSSYLRALELNPGFDWVWLLAARTAAHLGQHGDAERYARRAQSVSPNLEGCALVLGDVLQAQDKLDEATVSYQQAATATPANAEILAKLGAVQHKLRDLASARANLERAVQLAPDTAQFHLALASVLLDGGHSDAHERAETHVRRALAIDPHLPGAQHALGNCLAGLRRFEEAVSSYRKALDESTFESTDLHLRLGSIQHVLGRFSDAAVSFREALATQPDNLTALLGLGAALKALGKYTESIAIFERAVQARPNYAEPYFALGTVLVVAGRHADAEASFEKALEIDPGRPELHVGLASALMVLDDPERAKSRAERALDLDPDNRDAITLLATIGEHLGDHEGAYRMLSRVLDRAQDDVNTALCFASLSKKLGRQAEAISRIERLLASEHEKTVTERRNLLFMLGKLYNGAAEWDKAFACYAEGNKLKPLGFDPGQHMLEVDSLLRIFSADYLASAPRASVRSDRPVFVVGMPRSGTTLVEHILASHPQVFGAGELTDVIQMVSTMHAAVGTEHGFPKCAPQIRQHHLDVLAANYLKKIGDLAPDARRVVDKMPGNFMHLGLISMLFPDARVIHCTRDPLDTGLSCYFQDFSRSHPYSYDLYNIGRFYREYEKVMRHWRGILSLPMYEVQYENLVENQEAKSREMIEFLGLEWDDACLRFYESTRAARTASYDQVRQPIYRTSLARWKHYETNLAPLKAGLGWE
jgi:tetratricopeptide (TPR) repeat protein